MWFCEEKRKTSITLIDYLRFIVTWVSLNGTSLVVLSDLLDNPRIDTPLQNGQPTLSPGPLHDLSLQFFFLLEEPAMLTNGFIISHAANNNAEVTT